MEALIGNGSDELTPLQMSLRAVIVFMLAIVFLRFGRRAFGMNSPFDNVITILLGAVLSRAVVGDSPFVATIVASGVIIAIHRILAWISLYSRRFGWLVKGEPTVIYENGKLIKEHMDECLVTKNDLMETLRHSHLESLDEIKTAYVERDGKISIVKK